MAGTGNIKISELAPHANIDGREVMPVSWETTVGSGYESYKSSVDSLKSYFGTALGVDALKTQVTSYGDELAYLKRDLGQYYTGTDGTYNYIGVGQAKKDQCIDTAGNVVTKAGYYISNQLTVKAGSLYLIPLNVGAEPAADVALFAKVHKYKGWDVYDYTDGNYQGKYYRLPSYREDAGPTPVYEPLPHHYMTSADGGYGLPTNSSIKASYNNMAVFFAPEDAKIVISAPMSVVGVFRINYAVLTEATDRFIGANTAMSRVIAESLASLSARLDSCEKAIGTVGDTVVGQLDTTKMYKYCGGDLVVISKSDPSSTATATRPIDTPNHAGQLWVNVTTGTVWIGVDTVSHDSWKKITLTT